MSGTGWAEWKETFVGKPSAAVSESTLKEGVRKASEKA